MSSKNIFEESKKVKSSHFTFFEVLDLPEILNCMLSNLDRVQSIIIHQSLVDFAKNPKHSKKTRLKAAKLVATIEANQHDKFEGKNNPIIPTGKKVFRK